MEPGARVVEQRDQAPDLERGPAPRRHHGELAGEVRHRHPERRDLPVEVVHHGTWSIWTTVLAEANESSTLGDASSLSVIARSFPMMSLK